MSPTAGTLQDIVVPGIAVHGQVGGIEYTLLGCNVPVEPAGGLDLGFDAEAVIEGALLGGEDDEAFGGLRLGVENLAAFAQRTTLQPGSGASLLTTRSVGPVSAEVNDLTVAVVWELGRRGEMSRTDKTVTFGERVVLDVSSTRLLSVTELRKVRRRLQDVVTFVTGTASASTLSRVILVSGADTATPLTTTARFYEPWPQSPAGDDGVVVPAGLVMRLEDMPWQNLLLAWFESYEAFRPVLGTLLAHRFLPTQFVENRALHLVIAAEQTYRALGFNDYFMPETRLSRLRKMVIEVMSADETLAPYVDRVVKEQLQRRVSLDDRLRALVNYVGEPAQALFGGTEGVERWVLAAKRARNDLGHTGHTDRLSASALGAVAVGTEALLELVIAKNLGLDESRLAELVVRRHGRVTGRMATHLAQIV